MSHTQIIIAYILTLVVLSSGHADSNGGRLSQDSYFWASRAVTQNQNTPYRFVAPAPVRQTADDKLTEVTNRLQMFNRGRPLGETGQGGFQGFPQDPYFSHSNINYKQPENSIYKTNQNDPAFSSPSYPSQTYPYPGQNQYPNLASNEYLNPRPNQYPAYSSGYLGQGFNSRYPSQGKDPGPNNVPVYNPNQPSSGSLAQFPGSVPNTGQNNLGPVINPGIPYNNNPPNNNNPRGSNMRPAPQDSGLSDRNREAQNSLWNQWLVNNINAPSFWDKTGGSDRRGGIPAPAKTTTTPEPTTTMPTAPPPRVDPNFFNPDGSTNTNRLGMIKAPVEQDTVRDRQGGNTAYNLFWSLLGKNFFTDTAKGARGRSKDGDSVPRPKLPPTVSDTPMYDKPYEGISDEFLSTNYTQGSNTTGDWKIDVSQIYQRSDTINDKYTDDVTQTKLFNKEGKMYQSEVYSDTIHADDTKLDSVNGHKASKKDQEKKADQRRSRRQANLNNLFNRNGISCRTPSAFPSCQFYPRCFSEVNQECVSRDSFIGDDVSSICSDLHALATRTESEVNFTETHRDSPKLTKLSKDHRNSHQNLLQFTKTRSLRTKIHQV
ncbi:hypothetical protein PoB_003590800 [Plakobranchus ocellatus]|uniref:Uncharacterized protein n=1 Tax=Plakobranchus ocellatus TaxID=259542 RepID=A0AAV4AS51_9GAST|nr:hypothetical protein PoB_003590800 [Plakobranchus ocellatus]